ncbi:MAG: lmo0937 family membrane protein [Candidatus Dormibacteraeota bacterium]|uniref:Lmo0937 family membrane protein n=1 Tax=Candidatus Amunia macphersoniae TaxID=3127014 RepID=A0A934KMH0_9BACT|nr:lmo0937 family membrane protein [Candidatus Dormibacteraeota bacterium]
MLWVVVAVLVVLWLLGFVVVHVTGFFIHILLILAVLAAIFALFDRSRA